MYLHDNAVRKSKYINHGDHKTEVYLCKNNSLSTQIKICKPATIHMREFQFWGTQNHHVLEDEGSSSTLLLQIYRYCYYLERIALSHITDIYFKVLTCSFDLFLCGLVPQFCQSKYSIMILVLFRHK